VPPSFPPGWEQKEAAESMALLAALPGDVKSELIMALLD
jgi:hypothetical protein